MKPTSPRAFQRQQRHMRSKPRAVQCVHELQAGRDHLPHTQKECTKQPFGELHSPSIPSCSGSFLARRPVIQYRKQRLRMQRLNKPQSNLKPSAQQIRIREDTAHEQVALQPSVLSMRPVLCKRHRSLAAIRHSRLQGLRARGWLRAAGVRHALRRRKALLSSTVGMGSLQASSMLPSYT